MAAILDTASNFQTTTVATVYRQNSSGGFTAAGTMNAKTKIKFVETTGSGSNMYGRIAQNPASKYKATGSDRYVTAVTMWLKSSQVQLVPTTTTKTSVNNAAGSVDRLEGVKALGTPILYEVKPGCTVGAYTGPSASAYASAGTYSAGTILSVKATYKDSGGTTWAAVDTSYDTWIVYKNTSGILSSNLQVASSSTPATVSQDTVVEAVEEGAEAEEYVDMDAAVADLNNATAQMGFDNSDALQALHNMQYVIGIPPKFTETCDPHYMEDQTPGNTFGRAYTEMFMMGNTVFSIQPVKVKYLPGFKDDQKQTFVNLIANAVNAADDSKYVNADGATDQLSGQLFEAVSDYNDYINTVNMLARVCSIFLGIGDQWCAYNKSKRYRDMDYSFYKLKKGASIDSDGNKNIFSIVTDTIRSIPQKLFTSVINDDTYIHFYMTADGTTTNESMSVYTKTSGLESLFNNNLSEVAQDIQFLAGTNLGGDILDGITEIAGAAGSALGLDQIVRYGENYLKGGRLVFPQMMNDCTFDRSYSGTCRFISPAGDVESIFLNCYLPLCYLWPYVLPQMLSDNMYRYPFAARVDAKGLFHCDLAVISNLRVQRGGQDGNCWTADGLPFEIDVSFDITPLYSKLMVTSARHPILFLGNSSLQEYLGAMCGISFTGDQIALKLNIAQAVLGNYVMETIPSMLRGYYDTGVASFLRNVFNF